MCVGVLTKQPYQFLNLIFMLVKFWFDVVFVSLNLTIWYDFAEVLKGSANFTSICDKMDYSAQSFVGGLPFLLIKLLSYSTLSSSPQNDRHFDKHGGNYWQRRFLFSPNLHLKSFESIKMLNFVMSILRIIYILN